MKPLCIYHGNCADGFGAAWAVRQAFDKRRIEFHAGVYQKEPPDVTDRHVIMVDFSYKRPVIDDMAQRARSILILDHHKTAANDLTGYAPPPDTWDDFMDLHDLHEVVALFDMHRSGAGITWDFFHDTTRPPLIDHIEDRDLWRFKLPKTREIQAAVFSYPYDFEVWDRLMAMDVAELAKEGEAIERKHFKDIDELLGVCQRRLEIGGHSVPVASLSYTLTSDAGHTMAEGEPFAACYWDTESGRVFSLRSTDDGLDVSAIAKAYGGGGHRNAAGFEVPRDHELART
jgi:oligoribonuclease NrnB/cAMP/cGMP phosphodiesterase (DHH superfamily)